MIGETVGEIDEGGALGGPHHPGRADPFDAELRGEAEHDRAHQRRQQFLHVVQLDAQVEQQAGLRLQPEDPDAGRDQPGQQPAEHKRQHHDGDLGIEFGSVEMRQRLVPVRFRPLDQLVHGSLSLPVIRRTA